MEKLIVKLQAEIRALKKQLTINGIKPNPSAFTVKAGVDEDEE